MSKELKNGLYKIIFGFIMYLTVIFLSLTVKNINQNLLLVLFLAVYFFLGGEVIKEAVHNIGKGRMLDENFLMSVATIGAFLVGDYSEAVAVMLFYQSGEWFQSFAVNKSRKSIAELMDIRPEHATVLRNGEEYSVRPEEVKTGEVVIIKPGERVPLDGIVEEGSSTVDTMALTGESIPRFVSGGGEIISGCVNLSGVLKMKVEREYENSTVNKILDLVENAADKKSESENFITKFARYYTPFVVFSALLIALIPSVITGEWNVWMYRALTFLVISCPCALVISIPLSFFGGIGGAGKAGILIKGSNYIETLANAKVVAIDKTGTLTKGIFKVTDIVPCKDGEAVINCSENMKKELLEKAAYAESRSNHPISFSIENAYSGKIDNSRLKDYEEVAGYGVKAVLDKKTVYVGRYDWMKANKISCKEIQNEGTVVYIAEEFQFLGYLRIDDEIREDAADTVKELYHLGLHKIVMLTGDRETVAKNIAEKLNIKEYFANLFPADKVRILEKYLKKEQVIFVGDGMNDAPVLARADAGIAMGGLGSDAAIEAADVVIMNDEFSKVAKAITISRKTLKIVRQNIVFAIGVKMVILLLAPFGLASMWAAVFSDVGVTLIAILNAMRAMKIK